MDQIIFWWSIVSTVIGVGLLCASIWQYKVGEAQKQRSTAQVKIWMQEANGISQSLNRIIRDNIDGRYSTTNDVCNAVWAVQASTFSLYQSLYEERCIPEDEYKEKQRKIAESIEKENKKQTKK